MSRRTDPELKSYITDNVKKAIDNGYIQVYFQPVIRTFTGNLCGSEALARWLDPDHGLILPEIFIPVLEEAHLIHIFDGFMIKEVASRMKVRIDKGLPVIPVSLNLSGNDFLDGDPYADIEKFISEYDLRSSLIGFEVTESTVMIDDTTVKEGIEKLRRGGYKVRLDDFGSELSSINILNDLDFDEIKIDMQFIRNLNDRKRHILRSIITMAKGLGIHTLAKGAETEEQVEFLRSIGCEKIQGNYFGSTVPFDDMMQHCRDFGIAVETEGEAGMYDKAGIVDINVSQPIGLFLDDGKDIKILYVNDECRATFDSIMPEASAFSQDAEAKTFASVCEKFRAFAPKVIQSNSDETMTYVDNGQYLRLTARLLAEFDGSYIYRIELYNITYNKDEEHSKLFDTMLRNTANIYRSIHLWDVEDDSELVIQSDVQEEQEGTRIQNVMSYRDHVAETVIYPDDRERYYQFSDAEHIYSNAQKNRHGFVVEEFRFKQSDGNYKWLTIIAQVLDKLEGRPILILIRDTAFNDHEFRESFAKRLLGAKDYERYTADGSKWSMDGELWRYLMKSSSTCYFWKDKKRRFVGASQSFLDAFEIKDISDIYGKTDEDLGWNVDDTKYKKDELSVINEGKSIVNAIGTCVIKGDPRTIAATKIPIYQNGEIIGLLGYFVDTEASFTTRESLRNVTYTDSVTGFLNYRGLIGAGLRFDENFRNNKEDFIAVIIDVPEYDRIRQRYGEKISDILIIKIADLIREFSDIDAVIARLEMSRFIMYSRVLARSNVRDRIHDCMQKIHDIHDIDGFPTTLNPQYSFVNRSEVKSMDGLMDKLSERLAIVEGEDYSASLYSAERIIFEREKFDEMDERIYIVNPANYDLLYANKTLLRDLKLSDDYDISHKKCYEVIMKADHPCSNCSIPMCKNDRFYTWNNHNIITGKDYLVRDTLIPWKNKYAKFSMAVCLTDYNDALREGQEFLYREMTINDAVSVAMRESNIEDGIMRLLEKIGEDFKASRACLFEDMGRNVIVNTYEWCKSDVISLKTDDRTIAAEAVKAFRAQFERDDTFIAADVLSLKETYPRLYEMLAPRQIERLVVVELRHGEKVLGYLGIDDPELGNINAIKMMMHTVSIFITFMLRNRNLLRELDVLGTRDAMTGVMNRRALKNAGVRMGNSSVALIFGDLNGLKKMNDTVGHEAGDAMIKTAANILSGFVGSENVYRMGGDEFLIVTQMNSQSDADSLLASIRAKCVEENISIAFGCVWKEGPVRDIDELAKEADKRMYLNKQYMHGKA